ncbi:protein SMAX1-LIKE 3 isoform X2 [Magnolia sinica]|uniref:protein SMAX1-LIKE 3 isoform X2 n=1 Tax=Magnolia sinica TaxID=86752 RepID=UPI002659113E|nr:protein SMAX1-LIKE 3 isoform X2 [Magnolia sinica]
MRTGGCTVQQALTPEAASIVKQAVSLARRRGHAQVTPLHVANTMLASSTGLLRTACLQSHSHPLQCKALELCFNVALNRLPASTSSPMLGPHSHHPSLSNALVAAFKRAQAHQRRGSIENQQQPLLAVKVEVEQLIISILDDPSVSRVMREAGFSSTQVKSNVEQAVSLEICPPNPPPSKPKESGSLLVLGSTVSPSSSHLGQFGLKTSKGSRPLDHVRSEDVMCVMENLIHRRRRSCVIVGEDLSSSEGVVRNLMDRVDKGEVPDSLRNVQFISLPLFSLGHLSKEEVEQKLGEIRCLVKSCVGRGAVLYMGDLKWAAEYRASSSSIDQRRAFYCPVEHMIMELGRLVCGAGESGRLWLMGIATYQTYMRCRVGNPSLEATWGLHPIAIPAGSLALSLNPDSDSQGQSRNKRIGDGPLWSHLQDGLEKQLTCCADCSTKFETEARGLVNSAAHHDSTTVASSLPTWLQQYKEENRKLTSNDQIRDLCKKWNSICNSLHKHHQPPEKTLSFCSVSPSSSVSSYDHPYTNLHQTNQAWPLAMDTKQRWRGHYIWMSDVADEGYEPNLRMYIPEHREPKPTVLANPNPNSASSSDTMEMEYPQRFKELNAEDLKTLCNALEQKVPWQKDITPEIASTILRCRSGMVRRKGKSKFGETKEDTWLFFQGSDIEGKEKIARELASLVFGSNTNFISIGLSSFSSVRTDYMEDLRNKRSRAESSCSYIERFANAVSSNPHRVFFLEDIEQIDYYSHLGIKSAIERGRIRSSNGDEVRLHDAIIIFSCERFDSRSRASSPPIKQRVESGEEDKAVDCEQDTSPCISLDLNLSFDDAEDDPCIDDVGLLETVDGRFVFNLRDDL